MWQAGQRKRWRLDYLAKGGSRGSIHVVLVEEQGLEFEQEVEVGNRKALVLSEEFHL